jgi:hypothetical protein
MLPLPLLQLLIYRLLSLLDLAATTSSKSISYYFCGIQTGRSTGRICWSSKKSYGTCYGLTLQSSSTGHSAQSCSWTGGPATDIPDSLWHIYRVEVSTSMLQEPAAVGSAA